MGRPTVKFKEATTSTVAERVEIDSSGFSEIVGSNLSEGFISIDSSLSIIVTNYYDKRSNTASDILIADTGGDFDATTVEGALVEILEVVDTGKDTVATSITTKGGTVTQVGDSPTFLELSDGVDSIPTGGAIESLELGQDLLEFDLVKIISDIAYKNDIENTKQYAIGDFDTKGDEVVFNSGSTSYTSVIKMTDDIAIVCYRDSSNSNYGTSILLEIDYTAFTGKIGQLLETGTDGQSKDILIFKEYI